MKENLKTKTIINNEKEMIEFLIKTKEGCYGPVEESSFPYSRIKEETENIETYQEEIIYYSIA